MIELREGDFDDYDPDDDWYDDGPWDDDDDYDREPDPEDWEIARSYEELYEHEEKVHGGGECDCRPSLLLRFSWRAQAAWRWLTARWYRLRYSARQPWTLRLGPAEVTVRLQANRSCGACADRGWFYSKGTVNPLPMPPGYDGVSLCGCGTAIAKLADSRRVVRQMKKEGPPF